MMNALDAEVFLEISKRAVAYREANSRCLKRLEAKGFKMHAKDVCNAIIDITVENALLYEIQMLTVELLSRLPEKHKEVFYIKWNNLKHSQTRAFYRAQARMYTYCATFLEKQGYEHTTLLKLKYVKSFYEQTNYKRKARYANGQF